MNRGNQQPENQTYFYQFQPRQNAPVIQQVSTNYIPGNSFYPQMMQPMIIPVQPYMHIQQQMPNQQQQNQPQQQQQFKRPNKKQTGDMRPWTPEEDQIILNLYKMHGQRYDLIANSLQDRSQISVSNRLYELQRSQAAFPMLQPNIAPIHSIKPIIGVTNKHPIPQTRDQNKPCLIKYMKKDQNDNDQFKDFQLIQTKGDENPPRFLNLSFKTNDDGFISDIEF